MIRLSPLLQRALAVTLLFGLVAPAQGAQRGVAGIYDLYLGGIWLAELRLEAEIGRLGYNARATMKTTGIVKRFVEAGFDAAVKGRIARGELVPHSFEADTHSRDKRQSLSVAYQAGTPRAVKAEPPFKPKPWEIDPADQGALPDPVTAALAALAPPKGAALCDREVGIYDGRKRYALILSAPEPADGLLRCDAVYKRLGGFKPKLMKKPDFPLTLWFDDGPNGQPRFIRATGDTPLGTAVLLRRVPEAG